MEENNVKLLIFLEVKKHLQARKGKTRSRGLNSRFAVCRKHDSKSLYSLLDWTKEVRSSRKISLGRSGGGAGKGRRARNYIAQYLNFCIEKRRREMLVCSHYPWHVFFNACFHSRSFPLRADWRKSDSTVDAEPQGTSNSRDVVASSLSFSRSAARAPRRAYSKAKS